jgi:hypothetical protein
MKSAAKDTWTPCVVPGCEARLLASYARERRYTMCKSHRVTVAPKRPEHV